jgi:hypothetical protein
LIVRKHLFLSFQNLDIVLGITTVSWLPQP